MGGVSIRTSATTHPWRRRPTAPHCSSAQSATCPTAARTGRPRRRCASSQRPCAAAATALLRRRCSANTAISCHRRCSAAQSRPTARRRRGASPGWSARRPTPLVAWAPGDFLGGCPACGAPDLAGAQRCCSGRAAAAPCPPRRGLSRAARQCAAGWPRRRSILLGAHRARRPQDGHPGWPGAVDLGRRVAGVPGHAAARRWLAAAARVTEGH